MSRLRMRHLAYPDGLTRADLLSWYRAARARSRALFDLVVPDAYYDRPIALRNPIVFYDGHLPAFSVNTLLKLALGEPGIDPRFEVLFARGIDPEDEAAAKSPTEVWPSREEVSAYAREADERIERTLAEARIDDGGTPHLEGGEAVFTILEHEQMHHETLLYMLHNLPFDRKVTPAAAPPAPPAPPGRSPHTRERVRVPRGRATLGMPRGNAFGWDNELPEVTADVAAFEIDADDVTNGDFLEYVETTGAAPPHFWSLEDGAWTWRGMFSSVPLPLDAPVYVTHEQAAAFARWRGARLPTEAEYHRAAFGTPSGAERAHPWGDEGADASRGNLDLAWWDPLPVGSFPGGASAWGVRDLVGNGWEWTASLFGGFDGFRPMPSYPQYSADFFDGAHYVMKGASPATAHQLVRRTFRNWFRPAYPYVYATFRCARDVAG